MEVKKKGIGGFTVFFGVISSMLFLDTIASSANMGAQVFSWYIILAIMFFIPMGFIVAELGATYPDKGGIYGWIKRAFGVKWASRTSWLYWINAALWMPATIIFITGILAQLVYPEAGLMFNVIGGVIISWIVIYISSLSAEESSTLNFISGVIKLILPICLVLAAIYYTVTKGAATQITLGGLMPDLKQGLDFLPVVVYNMCGLEIILGNVHKFDNPKKDVPKSVISGAITMSFVYIVCSIAILCIIPVENVGVVEGFVDAFIIVFGSGLLGKIIVLTIGALFTATLVTQIQSWTLGSAFVVAEAAEAGEMPEIFAKYNKNESPVGALLMTGLVSTFVIVLYGFMASSSENLFWMLFEFSSMLFLMPYVILVFAFVKLRKLDQHIERPFRFPGSEWIAKIFAVGMSAVIMITIMLFVWVPGYAIDWAYTIPVVGGVIISIIVGEFILLKQGKKEKISIEDRVNKTS
ncbi:MAG: amino acid permease [Clostridiales bacterium]|nr:amino acid permease [Clostridiales bacterium]